MRTLSGILLLSVLPGCSSGSEPDQTSTAPSGSQIRSHAVEMSAQPAALSPAEAPAGQQMVSDPAGPGQGDFLVLCSGSFSDTGHLRSASRYASQRDCRIGVTVSGPQSFRDRTRAKQSGLRDRAVWLWFTADGSK